MMTIHHHPSQETLVAYEAGRLDSGMALVVAVHLSACAACRQQVAALSEVAAVLFEDLPEAKLAPESLARMLTMIDAPIQVDESAAPRTRRKPAMPETLQLPQPLREFDIGAWLPIWPGIRLSLVDMGQDPDARVVLLRVGAGKKLPRHGHVGLEFNQVISGSFSDEQGTYFPGDFVEADSDIDHRPVVSADGPCVCVISMVGAARLYGVLGRLLQPLIGT